MVQGVVVLPLLAQAADAGSADAGTVAEGSGGATFDELYEQYNGEYIVGGLSLAVVFLLVYSMYRSARSVSKYGEGLGKAVRRAIKSHEDNGNFGAGADILFDHEKYDDAAELYNKAGDFLRAGEAYERAGQTQRAVQSFKRGGAPTLAGEAYQRRGQFQLAAREFVEAGLEDRAADCYFKAKDYREAAELFTRLDRPLQAGEAYARLNDRENASAMFVRHFDVQFDMARGELSELGDARELAARAATMLIEMGREEEAAHLLDRAGYRKRAAELFTRLGQIEEAARIYVDAEKPMYAARLYDSVGDQAMALKYRAQARIGKGDRSGAAKDYASAGEYAKAAELYNDAGEHVLAAEMYDRSGDQRMAADLFKMGGDLERAAEAYEKGHDFDQAADLYRELGDHNAELRTAKAANNFFRVGEILLSHGRAEDALAAFQRVDPTDPRFEKANVLQGDIMRRLGRMDVAYAKYKAAIGGARPDKNNVDIIYRMAETAEEAGSAFQALQLYEAVIGVDYYYKEASERATRLRQHVGSDGGLSFGLNDPLAAPARTDRTRTGTVVPPPSGQVPVQKAAARYEIVEEIARGGMGIVYKARDTVLDRVVAYKILAANLKTNDVAVKYFLREAQASAKMSHPNIVTVYDAGEQDGEYYMAMEFVEGQTLKTLVNRQGAFPEKLLRYILVHVCRGLAYAHERGLVHRDVKPGNLMLTRDRTVKIMDFGLAKFVEEVQANHTRAIGTPYYMSPEQIVGKELDGRSDVYSLGVSMFECATGHVPFSKGDLSYHHLHTEAPRVDAENPKISQELADIILKCMAKSPEDRFASVHELMAAVRE